MKFTKDTAGMLTLYDYKPSQNAYKVRLLLNHLELPYQVKYISIFEGEGKTDEYRAINPTGAVPALVLSDGSAIAESNAILIYLSRNTVYQPNDPLLMAKVLQWLFFEADYVQSTVATLRHWVMTGKDRNRSDEILQDKRAGSHKVLSILDEQLRQTDFLTGSRYTIADIAVYAYVHLCDEAGLQRRDYPNIEKWCGVIEAQPGYLDEKYPYSLDPFSARELA